MNDIGHFYDMIMKDFSESRRQLLSILGMNEEIFSKIQESEKAKELLREKMKDDRFRNAYIAIIAFGKAEKIVRKSYNEYLPF